jgi:hypothetical protein
MISKDHPHHRKQQFMDAVQILAPDDAGLLEFARRVREAELRSVPGAAALEFVANVSNLRSAAGACRRCAPWSRAEPVPRMPFIQRAHDRTWPRPRKQAGLP